MPITSGQRRACAHAAASGLPFALWHSPHGRGNFTLAVSTGDAVLGPVFGTGLVPGFVMAPFLTSDATQAWIFPADVLITADEVRFRGAEGFVERPVTSAQSRIAGSDNTDPVMISAPPRDPLLPTSPEEYRARVLRAVEAIRRGSCEKIVLSRVEPRVIPAGRDLCDLTEELADVHPHAFTSLASSPSTGTWLTATPEILLSTDSKTVRTMALAGTQWPDPAADLAALQWSRKIVDEQAFVAKFIRAAFNEEGFDDLEETGPYTVQAANLCHLRSDFHASYRTTDALSDLLRRLHPTSAVCGMPKSEALDFIIGEEGATRTFYTGYLGPRGFDGETNLYVNLRSARVDASNIYLHVGGGIVEASDPELEWQETVEKTKTIARVLHTA